MSGERKPAKCKPSTDVSVEGREQEQKEPKREEERGEDRTDRQTNNQPTKR